MTARLLRVVPALLLLATTSLTLPAFAQDADAPNPLAPFARLIGGEWQMGDTYQVFEWGTGELSLVGRSYRVDEGGPVQVGDGMLFYHPGEQTIRGFITAIGMGIDLFDYRVTSIDDDRIVFELQTYGAMQGTFEEVWAFTDDDHFEWSLSQVTEEGKVEMMSGTFERKSK